MLVNATKVSKPSFYSYALTFKFKHFIVFRLQGCDFQLYFVGFNFMSNLIVIHQSIHCMFVGFNVMGSMLEIDEEL